jgi:quinol-cytochrome oxidoreductase complex cytochrome b subunit
MAEQNKGWGLWETILKTVQSNKIWKSIFRREYPQDDAGRMRVMTQNFWLHIHPPKVYKNSIQAKTSYGLGTITFTLFLLLVVTGILLMFYYVPDTHRAYQDMKDLEFAVSYGILLRNMHRWSAHAMVLLAILHMMRVFYAGAYKTPREFNWAIGVILLVLTFLLSFTGYLLPWDQLAIWAITVGTNMGGATPLLGNAGPFHEILGMSPSNDVRFVLLGGTVVGQSGLLRFYVLHCIALPVVTMFLISIHFWRVRKDGGLARPLKPKILLDKDGNVVPGPGAPGAGVPRPAAPAAPKPVAAAVVAAPAAPLTSPGQAPAPAPSPSV